MLKSIKTGISSCLLGNKVRYDGGHSHDRFLTQTLGLFVGYVPLIVPITLTNHYVIRYDQTWLKVQTYLSPHPFELKLRNYF